MTTNKETTGDATTTRRCVGSARFGIEPHEAQISDFPKQPSQKDGLGRMCQEHWRAYTSGLHKDAPARKASEAPAKDAASTEPETNRRTKRATSKPSPNAAEVEHAEALISEVDTMPAEQMAKRVVDTDVQEALETSAVAWMLAD